MPKITKEVLRWQNGLLIKLQVAYTVKGEIEIFEIGAIPDLEKTEKKDCCLIF